MTAPSPSDILVPETSSLSSPSIRFDDTLGALLIGKKTAL